MALNHFIAQGIQFIHPSVLRNLAHVSRDARNMVQSAFSALDHEPRNVVTLRRACAVVLFSLTMDKAFTSDICDACINMPLYKSHIINAMTYSSIVILKRIKWTDHNHFIKSLDHSDKHMSVLLHASTVYDDIEFMRVAFDVTSSCIKNCGNYLIDNLLYASCPQQGLHIDSLVDRYEQVRCFPYSRVASARVYICLAREAISREVNHITVPVYHDGFPWKNPYGQSSWHSIIIASMVIANNSGAIRALTGSDEFPRDCFIEAIEYTIIYHVFCDFAPHDLVRAIFSYPLCIHKRDEYDKKFLAKFYRDMPPPYHHNAIDDLCDFIYAD